MAGEPNRYADLDNLKILRRDPMGGGVLKRIPINYDPLAQGRAHGPEHRDPGGRQHHRSLEDTPVDGAAPVLHVLNTLQTGGAEYLVLNLARALDRRRFPMSVCSLQGDGEIGAELRGLGVPTFVLERRVGLDPLLVPKLVRIIRRAAGARSSTPTTSRPGCTPEWRPAWPGRRSATPNIPACFPSSGR